MNLTYLRRMKLSLRHLTLSRDTQCHTSDTVSMTHHSITSIVRKNDNVNWGGVVGNTDTSFFWPILSETNMRNISHLTILRSVKKEKDVYAWPKMTMRHNNNLSPSCKPLQFVEILTKTLLSC